MSSGMAGTTRHSDRPSGLSHTVPEGDEGRWVSDQVWRPATGSARWDEPHVRGAARGRPGFLPPPHGRSRHLRDGRLFVSGRSRTCDRARHEAPPAGRRSDGGATARQRPRGCCAALRSRRLKVNASCSPPKSIRVTKARWLRAAPSAHPSGCRRDARNPVGRRCCCTQDDSEDNEWEAQRYACRAALSLASSSRSAWTLHRSPPAIDRSAEAV